MVIFGKYDLVEYWWNNTSAPNKIIINFTSPKDVMSYNIYNLDPYRTNFLFDPNMHNFAYDDNFTLWYKNYILTNRDAYTALLNLIVMMYRGDDIFIMIDNNLFYNEDLVESLINYIQNDLGYICNIVNEIEDFEYLKEGTFNTEMLPYIDNMVDQYSNMVARTRGQYNAQ